MTDAEMLAALNTAVNDVLLYGQSTSVPGRTFTRANLNDLERMRLFYETRVRRATAGPVLMGRGQR